MKRAYLAAQRVARRIGRRGASLLFIGFLSASMSFSAWSLPPDVLATPLYQALTALLPLWVWITLWGLAAVTSLTQAFMRFDRVAYSIAAAMVAVWGLVYFITWFQGVNERGWVGGSIFLAFAGWITIISTWPEALDMRQANDSRSAIIAADREGTITSFNRAAEDLFGWTAQKIIGRHLTDLMPERFRAAHETGMARVTETGHSTLAGQVIALTGLRHDGTEFPMELTITVWPTPEGPTYTGVIRNPAQVP